MPFPIRSRVLSHSLLRRGSNQFNSLFLSKRNLSIHEYQSVGLLKEFKINVPQGQVCFNKEEVGRYANSLVENGVKDLVVKAQVLTGGRGKGHFDNGYQSGVHITHSVNSAIDVAEQMIGHRLITKQTTSKGIPCEKGPILIGSSHGGMNIEEVAKNDPSAIHQQPINVFKGLSQEEARDFLKKLSFTDECLEEGVEQLIKLYKLFVEKDCTMIEINPFCETNDGTVYCLDCKLQFDPNALFRQPDLIQYTDTTQIDCREVDASKNNLNYVGLDGNIGCLVNGAGLAMSTMDIIHLNGGSPANFLDVGGGATVKQVFEAFRIITGDPNVRAILVNIFGGIMRCDVIAEGIIEAAKNLSIKVPIVVRLQGTKMDEAKALIGNSGLRIMSVDDLDSASKLKGLNGSMRIATSIVIFNWAHYVHDNKQRVCKLAHIVEIAKEAKARRKNAGRNMKALLAKDIGDEGDDDFYKNIYGGFNEKSDDKEFRSGDESSADYFDSDFGDSESDIDEAKVAEEEKEPRKQKKKSTKQHASANGYPHTSKSTKNTKKDIDLESFNSDLAQITSSKSKKSRKQSKPPVRTLTQQQLLAEAKITEKINLESLKNYVNIDLTNKANKPKRILHSRVVQVKNPAVRYCSKVVLDANDSCGSKTPRTSNTLNFNNSSKASASKFDNFFKQQMPTTRRQTCEISAKKARYRDPLTGSYFHDVGCFRKLRTINSRNDH